MSAAKKAHAADRRIDDSRSAVERAIDRSKDDKNKTWDEETKEVEKKSASWGSKANPHK